MKYLIAVLSVCVLLFALTGCSQPQTNEEKDLMKNARAAERGEMTKTGPTMNDGGKGKLAPPPP
jgi:hypothetical protein